MVCQITRYLFNWDHEKFEKNPLFTLSSSQAKDLFKNIASDSERILKQVNELMRPQIKVVDSRDLSGSSADEQEPAKILQELKMFYSCAEANFKYADLVREKTFASSYPQKGKDDDSYQKINNSYKAIQSNVSTYRSRMNAQSQATGSGKKNDQRRSNARQLTGQQPLTKW